MQSDEVNADSTTLSEPEDGFAEFKWEAEQEKIFEKFDFASEMGVQLEIVEAMTDVREKMPEVPWLIIF